MATLPSPAELIVHGTIYDEWIEPLPHGLVMVFDQDIRHEHLLGQQETTEHGVYRISYNRDRLDRDDKGGADIVVRLYNYAGALLKSSDIFFNAPANLQVDLDLGPRDFMGASDFVRAFATIRPFIGKLTVAELTEDATNHDLSFLISKTGISARTLLQLVASFRFEHWAPLQLQSAGANHPEAYSYAQPEQFYGAEVYYGILSQNNLIGAAQGNTLPGNVEAAIEQAYINCWGQTVAGMMSSLQESAMKNAVTYALLKAKDTIQTQLQQLKANPPAVPGGSVVPPIVYNQIGIAGLNAGQQQVFLENYQPSAATPAFWTNLSNDPNFSGAAGQATIAKLQTVLQLSDWSAGNTNLVAYLMNQQHIQSLSDLSSLVGNTVSDWVTIIQNSGAVPSVPTTAAPDTPATPTTPAPATPGTPSVPSDVQAIASSIAAGIEKTYPTQVLTARINRNTTYNPTNKSYITGVLNGSGFDIYATSVGNYVGTYVQNNPIPSGTDQQTIAHQVMGIQRVYKATQNADAALTLLTDNVQSARQIYAMGRSNFVSQYSATIGDATKAGAIYDQAEQIHSGAAYLTGQLISRANNPATNMLPDYNDNMQQSKLLTQYPDLGNLFGMAASYCKCADCESFLGIPAYLADLLDFLFQRKGSGSNARAFLMANDYQMNGLTWRRRPDIGDIDLNCANTDTELPYIDITNELLEDYIIPPIAGIRVLLKGDSDTMILIFLKWLATYLAPGKINLNLYNLLMQIGKDPKTPICNIDLLTPDAIVSVIFFSDGENYPSWMMQGNPLIAEWVIRDQFITLKLSLMTNQQFIGLLPNIFGSDLIDIDATVTPGPATPTSAPATSTALAGSPATPTPAASVDETTYNKLSSIYSALTFAPTNNDPATVNNDNVNNGNGNRDGRSYFALIVQETHQTHLTTAEIDANPEYTNTNVYNSLSDPFNTLGNNKWDLYPTKIPISLPFDLYFAEANTFLEKMGKQRSDLMNTYRQQGSGSLDGIIISYMGLSTGDAYIIFTAMVQVPPAPDPQKKFWGALVTPQPPVNRFLTATGLSFEQLERLLTLSFINPTGDSYIAGTQLVTGKPGVSRLPPPTIYDACNTALMVIANMTSTKFDHINRFLRLWTKLNLITAISMQELNDCIMCPAIGNGSLDMPFAEAMYCFLQLMSQLNFTATELLTFYQDIDTAKNDDLYQQLFQNRQISNPLVAAFNLPLAGTSAITDTQSNPGAVPVILTACGITQDDLTAIMNLDTSAYTLLTLDNLSFIYSCGLLANALGIPVADLFTLAALLNNNPLHQPLSAYPSATPASTLIYVTQFNQLQQAGFTVDALNYLLTNQSLATPSLIPNATAVVTGLESIRTALQAAVTATSVVPDPQGTLLTKWLADPQLSWDPSIAARLLSILGQTDSDTYTEEVQENLRMLQLLRTQYGAASTSAWLDRLPDIVFPGTGISDIVYDNTNYYLFYLGTISADDNTYLQALPSIDAAGQTAIQQLYQQSQTCPISAVLAPGAGIPAWFSGNQASITQNTPAFSCAQGALGFTGTMTLAVYNSLLAQSPDTSYACALGQLLVASQGIVAPAKTFIQLSALPPIALPDSAAASLTWSGGILSFTGAMSAADGRTLLALSTDTNFQAAICQLFITAEPGQTASTPLAALPAGWTILPDLSTIGNILVTPGATPTTATISFTGQMSSAVHTALGALSILDNWPADITALFTLSQSSVATTASIPALPAGVTDASFTPYGLANTTPGGQTTPILLTYTGVMSDYILEGLLALSTDAGWATAMTTLFQQCQDAAVTGVTLPQPASLNTAAFAANKVQYSAIGSTMTLQFTGQMQPQTLANLVALSTDPTYFAAVNSLFNQVSALYAVSLPPIQIPLPDAYLSGAAYTSGAIVFTGTPDVVCNDGFNLEQLSTDTRYSDAISFLYNQPPLPVGTVGAVLSSLPPVSLPASIAIAYGGGELSFTGQMLATECIQLLALSANASWHTAINQLYVQSQVTSLASVPALSGGAFPDSVTKTQLNANGVNLSFSGDTYVLSFTGPMSAAQQTVLLALVPPSTNDDYTKAIQSLYTGSQSVVVSSAPLAALPPITLAPAAITAGWDYDTINGVLYYTGGAPISSANVALVGILNSTDPDFQAAIALLAGLTTNPGTLLVFAPPPETPFASSGITLANGATIGYQGGTLAFTGPMSFADWLALLSLSGDTAWRSAVTNVFLASQPVAPGTTVNSSGYFALPAITIPPPYANQLAFTPATSTLTLRGYIADPDFAILNSAGTAFTWQQSLIALDNAMAAADSDVGNDFADLYTTLLTGSSTPLPLADRYAFFLEGISADYQSLKEANALATQIASNCGVTVPVASVLATEVFTVFTDPAFVGNSKAINPDPQQYPLAQWYLKLTRMGFLISSFNLAASDTEWLLDNGTAVGALDLNAWPSATTPLTFAAWEVLNAIVLFERAYPAQNVPDPANPGHDTQLSVYTLLSAAMTIASDIASLPKIPSNPGAYLAQLAQLTKWDPVQLAYLLDVGEPNPPNTPLNPLNLPDSGIPPVGCIPALTDISLLQRISDCFTIAGQLKVVPSRCVGWVTDPITDKIATDIKQALKSMYPDETSWLSAVQPLMNTLRQERRDALVEYLESNTVTNPFGQFDIFPDENSIYGNFLIDVEMNACQPTTRTIQAYCSIQTFVQRCFLNLEYPNVQVDSTADPDWLQWTWMGTFEGWYEARYIFLYPENFIIPQTLPGQSPFFGDMQNDLTQGAVTEAIVETAFGNYLESLDGVARLEVKGMWYDDPGSTLYVFARTYGGDPSVYYFRTLDAIGIWSAWEEVTADISGDEIIPVMQNGRLFLYWPVFTQTSDASNTSQKQTATDGNSTMASAPPDKYWKIQLAFSEYLNGKWTGKKVSKDYAISKTINFSEDGATWAPDTSDFVFIPLDIPPSVPGSASAAQKFGSVIQALTMNNTIVIGMFVNNTQYSSDGNPEIDQPGEELTLLSTPNGLDAFVLDPLRGYPSVTALSDWLDLDSMFAFLFIDDSNRFKNTWYSNMLVEGKLPLTPRQNGSDLATLLSNSSNPSCNTLLSLQMNLWAKWFFVNNGYIQPQYLGIMMPFFFQDASRTFFVKQLALTLPDPNPALFPPYYYYADARSAFAATLGNTSQLTNLWNQTKNWSADSGPLYEFDNFYHPYAHQFIRLYAQQGIGSVLTRPIQLTGDYFYGSSTEVLNNPIINIQDNPGYKPFSFTDTYSPNTGLIINASITEVGYPLDQVDFDLSSSYGRYNWELFFHNVLMSAMLLSQNQQFAEADAWFKCIFNPTDTSSDPAPQKFWVTKPFFENTSANVSIDKLILFYELDPSSEPDFWESVVLWRNDPYDPHMLAQLRITPYQYTTFMKYLDNLIAWANFYYAQYTMESVNQAIQLFMLALECLGPKPEAIPPVVETPVCSYYQLELNLEVLAARDGKDGYLSDPIVQFENLLPPISSPYKYPTPGQKKIQMLPGLYFCIPPNPVLMAYWDTIQTQLTKIRNCMNIKGQFQPLSPFPNVPGMGNNEGGGAGDWGGVLPNYKFLVMVQKAIELCNVAIPLGGGLLSALEKQDAEALAMMHATQEVAVQQAIDKIKEMEITDANYNLTSLQDYTTLLNDKAAYYNGLIQGGLISLEQQALSMNQYSLSLQDPITTGTQLSGVLKQLPNFTMGINGAFGSPAATLTFGGISLGTAADSVVERMSFNAHFSDQSAAIANTNANYTRRLAEWNFQLQQANDELAQNSTQLKAAQNKIDIATQDEENQQLLIQNAEDVASFLQNKYTNQQLYTWMISQISNVFFQCYQLAYTIAKQAEICFRYELGIPGTSYINYGYWDSLHKGLLSGENLMSSIRQMEMDYYNLNVREYELTRQISLAQLDPVALLQLKAGGTCYLDIPEALFDLDYPGQYFRRIRSVAITLPGIVGPYTPVCLKMTLMANSVRILSTAGTAANYPRNTNSKGIPTNDSRFLDNVAMTQCIATSTAVNDNGLFEMNMKDERYIPFEGAGAISSWQLQLTSVYPQFDASSVTDLIIHFKYTSREGGPALQAVAAESLQKRLATTATANGMALSRAFSARRDFPTQWYKFLNPVSPTDPQELDMDITSRFPFFTQGLTIKINSLIVLADMAGGTPSPSGLYISGVRLGATLMNLGTNAEFSPLLYYSTTCRDTPGIWKVTNGNGPGSPPPAITAAAINDLIVVFNYTVS